jgi:hypothetical protein
MVDLYVGLVRGVGKYFKEKVSARKMSADQVEVIFPS